MKVARGGRSASARRTPTSRRARRRREPRSRAAAGPGNAMSNASIARLPRDAAESRDRPPLGRQYVAAQPRAPETMRTRRAGTPRRSRGNVRLAQSRPSALYSHPWGAWSQRGADQQSGGQTKNTRGEARSCRVCHVSSRARIKSPTSQADRRAIEEGAGLNETFPAKYLPRAT